MERLVFNGKNKAGAEAPVFRQWPMEAVLQGSTP
ncbi:hypothetical protein EV286_105364 [Rhizobium sp. BK251]|nr:hypothetical protein EV286_105364 [Rhizobium sp. BK251]